MQLGSIILIFFIYSFLGWLCEEVFCSIGERKIVIRGFLFGPICPIYGFGGLVIYLISQPFKDYYILVFISAFLFTSLIEYITSYLLERIFKLKLWDYSKRKVNINGRVCLKNSLLFGILGLVLVYFVQPVIDNILNTLSLELINIIALCLSIVIIIDLIVTIYSLTKFSCFINKNIIKIKELFKNINNKTSELLFENKNSKFIASYFVSKYPNIFSTKHKIKLHPLKEIIKAKRENKKSTIE